MGYSLSLNEGCIAKRLLIAVLGLLLIVGSLSAEGWADKIKVKGDLRYRFEWYGKEVYDDDNLVGDTLDARYRNRVRARLGIVAKPEDNLEIGLRLATGSDDPASTNQTFDGAFTTKGFHLDRAYFAWKPVDGLWLAGGKMSPRWQKATSAFWDGDLAVEGLALGWNGDFDAVSPFASLNYLWVDEIKKSPDDVMLYLGQAGANFKLGEAKLMLGASYFTYTNIVGHGMLYDDDDFGNSTVEPITDSIPVVDTLGDTTWTYTYGAPEYEIGYNVIQPSARLSFKVGEFPISFHGDVVYNLAADEDNLGYVVGVKLGKAKKPGSFQLGFDYGALQKDCTMATFVDSDFAGGGVNSNGMKFAGAYQITKRIQAGATFFANTQKPASDTPKGYYRFQGDLKFKF